MHCEIHNLCNNCYDMYHNDIKAFYEKQNCTIDLSLCTFCTLLNAYAKLYPNYPGITFDKTTIYPTYSIIDNTPYIQIKCTYQMLEFLSNLYTDWIKYRNALEESIDTNNK